MCIVDMWYGYRKVVFEFFCECVFRYLSLKDFVIVRSNRLRRIFMILGRIMISFSVEIILVGKRMGEKCF